MHYAAAKMEMFEASQLRIDSNKGSTPEDSYDTRQRL
jgi:hypothetical protein